MGEIVNLRRARKQRERAQREVDASANRLQFGRAKSEKSATQAERRLLVERLESHRVEPPSGKSEA